MTTLINKIKYYKELKKQYIDLSISLFESINNDKRIDRKYLYSISSLNTFEIDEYYNSDEYEIVRFDLACQNTGNIYSYKYYKKQKRYEIEEIPLLFTISKENSILPNYILDQIFEVARSNSKQFEIQKSLKKKLENKAYL